MNFGVLELQTYWFLKLLTDSESEVTGTLEWSFKQRVDLIRKLADIKLVGTSLKSEFDTAWEDALRLAAFRNAIVHNPLVFGWHGVPEAGPPNVICVPDVGHLGAKPKITKPIASLDEINQAVNDIVRTATDIDRLLAECEAYLRNAQTAQ